MASSRAWNGAQLKRSVNDAIRLGLTAVGVDVVAPTQAATPVLTGAARRSVASRPAYQLANGRWLVEVGSYNLNYFIWLEIGARGRPGGYMLRRAVDQYASRERVIARIKGFLR